MGKSLREEDIMKSETNIKLWIYVEEELNEDEAEDVVADMVADYEEIYGTRVRYQILEVENDEVIQ
jgi:hypothetical protein